MTTTQTRPVPEFRLLGPLHIAVDGRRVQMTAPRLQAVLGTLLLSAGETVPVHRLVEAVWDERPPADPNNQLAVCMSMLRQHLVRAGVDGDLIRTDTPGYRISAQGIVLDLHQVKALREEAVASLDVGDKEESAETLRKALALWRGPLLVGHTRRAWQSRVRAWEEEQLSLRDLLGDIQLELGRFEDLIAELSGFIQEHPLFERPRAQLMTALYHTGRQADALQVYRDTCALLDAELAVAPGAELRTLHENILRGTVAPHRPAALRRGNIGHPASRTAPRRARAVTGAGTEAVALPATPPCLLPGDAKEFTGRARELSLISRTLVPDSGPVPVVGLVGPAGIGKTALAVHAAHRLRTVYRDGQLYMDLRGTGPDPVHPGEALGRFLRALGTPAALIPAGLEERTERYRGLLADRRFVIVLDDVADAEQIRPLLPGTGTCAVLTTSRRRGASVLATDVAELGPLPYDEALDLLSRVAGTERCRVEPGAAGRIVEYCGRLPLAVGVIGARIATKSHWSLAWSAEQLAVEDRRLAELTTCGVTLSADLDRTFHTCSPGARLLLGELTTTGPQAPGEWLSGRLRAAPGAPARESLLEELVDAWLIEVRDLGIAGRFRYRVPELVRLYVRGHGRGTPEHAEVLAAAGPPHSPSPRRAAA